MKHFAVPGVIAMALAVSQAGTVALAGDPHRACETEIARASQRYEVPLSVLYAVGLTESGKKGSLQAFALNIAGTAYFGADLADGIQAFEKARQRGITLIDIGCMQINHRYHSQHFASLAAMFDPAANVDYAARFLLKLKASQGSWTLAVARYNAGPDNNPAQKRYVCAVIANMVASGFGSWTPNARSFCR